MTNLLYAPAWRDINAERHFPLEHASTLLSLDGRLQLSETWLVDAALHPTSGVAPFCIGQVTVQENEATVEIWDSQRTPIASGTLSRSSTLPIPLYSTVRAEELAGTLVVDKNASHSLFVRADGVYEFGPGRADFVASVVMDLSGISGLLGFKRQSDTYRSADIVFVAEHGVQMEVEEMSEQLSGGRTRPVTRMRVHAVGDPQFLTRKCEDISRRPLRFIREVVFQYGEFTHVCTPNYLGNILFLAQSPGATESALQVNPTQGGIVVRLNGKGL